MNKKNKFIILIILSIFLAGGIFIFYQKKYSLNNDIREMTLSQASKMGEITTHKLLVQIKKSDNSYERGDIIGVFSNDHEFSDLEKGLFLIIKMDLTPMQGDLLQLYLSKNIRKDEEGRIKEEIVKQRKFYVDLEKAGISPDDEKGREIEGNTFQWNILKEKEI